MALLVPLAAILARRLVISLTRLLAGRRPAAFAGVGVHISFAPPPALRLVASLTEGTLVATSGTFAQFGVYFLDPRRVSAHMASQFGTCARRPRRARRVPRVTPRGTV
jgi:proline iminopeptidase